MLRPSGAVSQHHIVSVLTDIWIQRDGRLLAIGGHRRRCGPRDEDTQNECETHGLIHFVTRSQMNRVSTTGLVSSAASTRKVIRSGPWNVYHRRVALPTALGF